MLANFYCYTIKVISYIVLFAVKNHREQLGKITYHPRPEISILIDILSIMLVSHCVLDICNYLKQARNLKFNLLGSSPKIPETIPKVDPKSKITDSNHCEILSNYSPFSVTDYIFKCFSYKIEPKIDFLIYRPINLIQHGSHLFCWQL